MLEDQVNPIGDQDLDGSVADGEVVEQQEQAQPHVDWKAKAIEAETRLEMLERMRQEQLQQAQPEQLDEVAQLRVSIEEKRKSMPQLDDKNPQSFWERERVKEEIDTLQERLVEARMRQQERLLVNQQVGTVVQQYKMQHANRPTFRAVEARFDQMVSQLEPHLKGNQMMLEMIRKNLEYDEMSKGANQPKVPPSAPNGAYQPQAGQRANQGKVTWRSDEDRAVGEFYIQRGIIKGPEDFYDPKFNERSPSANNNGTAIYDVPSGKRGWRR